MIADEIKRAEWVVCPRDFDCPVITRRISVSGAKKAEIALSALGYFMLYVNGVRVGDEYFLPSASMPHERNTAEFLYPISDTFTYRAYFTVYDITAQLHDGENTVEIALGNGFYRQLERTAEGHTEFGDRLGAIYAISILGEDGENVILSDGTEECRTSNIIKNNIFYGETYDARITEFERAPVEIIKLPDTILTPDDSAPDRVCDIILPKLVYSGDGRKIYDVGRCVSGFATIKTAVPSGDEVRVIYADEYFADRAELNFVGTGSREYKSRDGEWQTMRDIFIGDGREHIHEPSFVWHAFRYFEVRGDAAPIAVKVIHSDVENTSSFVSSSEELNFIYEASINTQRNNMHGGFPSDCPHRERLGYTGDGQVTSAAMMMALDAKRFYGKWIRDIFDSQDRIGGHVNHTAPFCGGGGGPGGWGMAAIILPYNYYKIYGDITPARENFDNILRWVDYLEKHSAGGLIVREEEGGWCLGEWNTPDEVVLPEEYVNTCLYIRALGFASELAKALGRDSDAELFDEIRRRDSDAVIKKYRDTETGSFAGGEQGADAFALAAGLGDERTATALEEKYSALGRFDTGIFGTPLVISELFGMGAEDIAMDLLSSHELGSYGYFLDRGATSIWENWRGDNSLEHPMFGAVTVSLFADILGIWQAEGSCGFDRVVISPKLPRGLDLARGHITTPHGKLAVSWQKRADSAEIFITVPNGTDAVFRFNGKEKRLSVGTNSLTEKLY